MATKHVVLLSKIIFNIPILSFLENCPGNSEPECKDNWKAKKCQKQKQKGKCGKGKVAKNCQKTCGKC